MKYDDWGEIKTFKFNLRGTGLYYCYFKVQGTGGKEAAKVDNLKSKRLPDLDDPHLNLQSHDRPVLCVH